MLSISILFGIIVVVILALVFWYHKYMNISDVCARRIEIGGYIALFIVLVWEFYVKNIVMKSFYNADFYYLDQKLDYIFLMLEQDLGWGGVNQQGIMDGFWSAVQGEYVQRQMKFIDYTEAILKILSTVAIAVGRFQELKNNAKDSPKG